MNFEEFKEKYEKVEVTEYPNQVLENPFVSVLVQTYQQVKYIEQCIEGVLMQETDFDFEILVGEDDSNDGTREICIEYAKKYPDKIRLFLHSRENNVKKQGRPSSFFNSMYNTYSAKGTYMASCEGDDFWIDPHKIQKQVNFLEASPDYIGVYTNFSESNINGEIETEKNYRDHTDDDFSINKLLFSRTITRTLTVMYRRKPGIIQELPKFAKAMHGDKYKLMLMASEGKLKYLKDVTAVFRRGSGYYTPIRYQAGRYHKVITWVEIYKYFKDTKYREVILLKLNSIFWKYFRDLKPSEQLSLILKIIFRKKKREYTKIGLIVLFYKYWNIEMPSNKYYFNKIEPAKLVASE